MRATLRERWPDVAPVPVTHDLRKLGGERAQQSADGRGARPAGLRDRLHETADRHDHTAWRDALHPHLTEPAAAAWARWAERVTGTDHTIGLLLGTEEDWPRAFEALVGRLGPVAGDDGARHRLAVERITMEPFNLRYRPRYELVVDRLAYWYFLPREWLKKVALMDDVYLLNSPFTFQSMEKHTAYCAMMRLGLKVPETVLVPHKNPPANERFAYTAARYNLPFDLDAVAAEVGYPLFMKPYDGGQWIGVSRIRDADELHRAYDASGKRLMHLQASVEDYDVFARALSIGAETMVMRFRPEEPCTTATASSTTS